MYKDCGY